MERRRRRSDQACKERLNSRCSSQDPVVLWSDGAIATEVKMDQGALHQKGRGFLDRIFGSNKCTSRA